jgi:hypothetical protein
VWVTHCQAASASRSNASITEHSVYNEGNAADDARGIMLACGSQAVHVLMLQPQIIAALGLPTPTDPAYPYK